jgi:hypothetical protein
LSSTLYPLLQSTVSPSILLPLPAVMKEGVVQEFTPRTLSSMLGPVQNQSASIGGHTRARFRSPVSLSTSTAAPWNFDCHACAVAVCVLNAETTSSSTWWISSSLALPAISGLMLASSFLICTNACLYQLTSGCELLSCTSCATLQNTNHPATTSHRWPCFMIHTHSQARIFSQDSLHVLHNHIQTLLISWSKQVCDTLSVRDMR